MSRRSAEAMEFKHPFEHMMDLFGSELTRPAPELNGHELEEKKMDIVLTGTGSPLPDANRAHYWLSA